MECELIKSSVSDDCGCPEQSLIIGMAEVIIHLDPDGSGTAFIDMGEWHKELNYPCETIDDLKDKVIDYLESLPINCD